MSRRYAIVALSTEVLAAMLGLNPLYSRIVECYWSADTDQWCIKIENPLLGTLPPGGRIPKAEVYTTVYTSPGQETYRNETRLGDVVL